MVLHFIGVLGLHFFEFFFQFIHHFLRLSALAKIKKWKEKIQEKLPLYCQNGQKRSKFHCYNIFSHNLLRASNHARSSVHLVELTAHLPACTACHGQYARRLLLITHQAKQRPQQYRQL